MNEKLSVKHVFAYYLPQYHEIPENNEWWGEGFTEWTNVRNANKYNRAQVIHKPHSDLGFYSLNDPKVIEQQYSIARKNSIDTFCFWHYWFDNDDLLLQMPAERLLESDSQVSFCFAWANHSWFNKTKGILLKEQKYDYSLDKHFDYLLNFFKDERYRKIDNKPVLFIYDALNCNNLTEMKDRFSELAIKNGFDGVYFIFEKMDEFNFNKLGSEMYLNSCSLYDFRSALFKIRDRVINVLARDFGVKIVRFYKYKHCYEKLNSKCKFEPKRIPVILPNWDTTIRHGKGGVCLLDATIDDFRRHLILARDILISREVSERYIVIKSWNEWAEGNFIEPSELNGYSYLNAFSSVFSLVEEQE